MGGGGCGGHWASRAGSHPRARGGDLGPRQGQGPHPRLDEPQTCVEEVRTCRMMSTWQNEVGGKVLLKKTVGTWNDFWDVVPSPAKRHYLEM